MCFDAIRFRTVGGVSVDDIEWINRPTWQQAVEVQGHRGRGEPISQGAPTTTTTQKKKCRRHKKRHHRGHAAKKHKKKRCMKKRHKKR
jgi:hypothetical protein